MGRITIYLENEMEKWKDFPETDESRSGMADDIARESF